MQLFTNNANSRLFAGISNVSLSLQVAAGEGAKFPNPTGGDFFLATLSKVTGGIESDIEIVKVTARATDVFTIIRAQEGTAAQVYAESDWIQLRMTAASATSAEAHINSVANPHSVTKAQVGLGSVDNTADVDKPVSTAQATAIGLKINTSAKDATGGVPGLTLFKLNMRNAANTITSWFTNAATVARTWTLPDKDGTVAMTSDITGTNSGTNTGDNAVNTLYSGLVTNATHTGDVTGATALTIAANAVTNAKAAQMAVNTIKGRITAGTGNAEDLTAANVRTIINVADGANNYVHTTNANLTGEVTSVGNAATVPNATVIGKVLTGYVSGAGTVAATDTILQAVNKLNGNIALKANALNPVFTGRGSITGSGGYLPASTGMAAASGMTSGLDVTSQGTAGTAGAAFMTFHRPSAHAVHFGIDTDNFLKIGGFSLGAVAYKIWHEGADGAGSGLDADLLDGQQGAYYQQALVSGTNIKTVNGSSVLGSGNLVVGGLVIVPVSGTTQTAVAGNHYVLNNVAATAVTMPTTLVAGDPVTISPNNGLLTNTVDFGAKTVRFGANTMTGVVTLDLGAPMELVAIDTTTWMWL